MRFKLLRSVSIITLVSCSLALGGCGTMTGIPSHGGGKRFATEQRLVSASARAALKAIDVTPLHGRRVFVLYSVIADQGGGTLSGGRINLGTVLSSAAAINPVTSTLNKFQVFDLAGSGTNFQNQTGTSNSVAVGTNVSLGTNTGTSTTNGTSSDTQTGTSTTNGSGTSNDAGTSTGKADTTTTTGAVVTTQAGTSSGTSDNKNTSTSTSKTDSSGTNSGTSTSKTDSSGSSKTDTTSKQTSDGTSTGAATGGNTSKYQAVSAVPSDSRVRTSGPTHGAGVNLSYRGLGEYQNFPIPVSDISYLNVLVQTYFQLSGISTTQNINEADAVAYVLVDVFGTIRSRFDAVVYNSEDLTAETAIEMFAFDKAGRLILKPQTSNYEAQYGERYFMWAGPFETEKGVKQGKGQLVDFKDVRPGRRAQDASVRVKEGMRVPGME